ncbi:hypothetical protein PUNSTDRAFT_136143 [Punctularia strigosozonata HHB-11173 SS5]|uniref:uncharacterized protein n=1 Tax=Punctularia strigosozonata (strain HHB-11173) TaxID=741275 RepID=UPI000441761E|nr:uncharacterized protein PUNSTDRAFT_136143 [Punctularia strigosozonata HHB-11173 SS5]EIN07463.1 hypothetical protein PUNSTDRAFT_136143 [Punctularia strigosozonata HHB-11173 SS5]
MIPSSLSTLVVLVALAVGARPASLLHSVPEDPYAFPKYRVTFLNGNPVLNETAERWLQHGLRGGEPEFLEQPWADVGHDHSDARKEIGHADNEHAVESLSQPPPAGSSPYSVELMRLGPKNRFLCLVPPPLEPPPQEQEEELREVTPAHSWSLLQPLTGTCLYAWFTYSYCHNSHVRQFREMAHAHPHPPGGYIPEEDPEWEAYTLGRAPPIPEPGTELTVAEQNALAANLDIARGAGSRYLVQRWGDGTVCDKTGKKREIEIQFHCSMTTTDHILFVKETKTCSYVLVIQTPRLCGEPGFKSRQEQRDEALIRCREIVDTLENVDRTLPEADEFFKRPARTKPVLPPPPPPPPVTLPKAIPGAGNDMLRKALEAFLGKERLKDGGELQAGVLIEKLGEDGEIVVEFIGEDELDVDLGGHGEDGGFETIDVRDPDTLTALLRAAGFDVAGPRDEKEKAKKKSTERTKAGEAPAPVPEAEPEPAPVPRDEL